LYNSVINICQTAAWRLHGKNIRVNAICPVSIKLINILFLLTINKQGLIKTEMTDVVFDIIKGREAMETALMKTTALERYGKPEEVSAQRFFLYIN
jgi:NAD(P)-dependent dehydrogenase (short-subunit alcohol dehydrogenase family)